MARTRRIDDLVGDDPTVAADDDERVATPPAEVPAVATPPAPREAPAMATPDRPVAIENDPERRPVRTTVDLRADEYDAFVDWCAATAREVGRPRVHGQQVIRILVRRLMTDRRLAKQVTADLKKHAGQLHNEY